jgi:hypothetical protein
LYGIIISNPTLFKEIRIRGGVNMSFKHPDKLKKKKPKGTPPAANPKTVKKVKRAAPR